MLQRHFGIGALEARHVRPAWEIENLLLGFQKETGSDEGSGPAPDPFLTPPEE